MSTWFVLRHPTTVVYKDAETGEYCGQHSAAQRLNDITQEGLTPLYIIDELLGSGQYAIFTDSKWYFEASDEEMRRFEIPFELGDSVPIKASGSGGDAVVLELSDERLLLVVIKTDVEEDKWIDRVLEIPRYGPIVLGFTQWHSIFASDDELVIAKLESTKAPKYIEAEYQSAYVSDQIYIVNNGVVSCPSSKKLPERVLSRLPTGFIESADYITLMICGKSVYQRKPYVGFSYSYELLEEVIECRDEMALCADGFIYRLWQSKFIQMTTTPCSMAICHRKPVNGMQ